MPKIARILKTVRSPIICPDVRTLAAEIKAVAAEMREAIPDAINVMKR